VIPEEKGMAMWICASARGSTQSGVFTTPGIWVFPLFMIIVGVVP
jgi:hypothetical protein